MLDSDPKLTPRRHLVPVDAGDMPKPAPHSIEAEQSVLGSLLQDNDVAEAVRAELCPDHFYAGVHREIFQHIERVLASGSPADVVTVGDSLAAAEKLDYVGGMPYLGTLAQDVPTSANAVHYARIVRDRARRRAMIAAFADLADTARSPGGDPSDMLLAAHERLHDLAEARSGLELGEIDLVAIAGAPVPERRFRVGRIMPIGAPGLWTGHGGVGKTQAALHLAVCIALGRPFFGEDVSPGRVAYVATEDDAADLHYRLAHQVRVAGASLEELAGRLSVYDLTTRDPVLMTASSDGAVAPTPRYVALRAELHARGAEVVFLDNFSTLCAVDLIKPAHATQALALCARMVPKEGNAVLIAHVDKATAKAGHSREAYSGTAAFHNRARWRWYLFAPNRDDDADVDADVDAGDGAREDDGRRILEVQKVNAGRSGARIPLRILDDGAIGPDGVNDGIVAAIARRNEREAVLAAIGEAEARAIPVPTAETNRNTAHEALETMPSFPGALRGRRGKQRLFRLLRQMRADGAIEPTYFRGSGRHTREGYRIARIAKGIGA